MAKDLIDDRYGRFYNLPNELARLGNEVKGICLSYKDCEEKLLNENESPVSWTSTNLGIFKLPGLIKFCCRALKLAKSFNPDIIISASDSMYIIIGSWLARNVKALSVADLYDDFMSFDSAKIPGMILLLKKALCSSSLIISFSHPYAAKITRDFSPSAEVITIENGFSKEIFYPRDKTECRQRMGLPVNAKIFGTAGALYKKRNITILFNAFLKLENRLDNLHLVLAGPLDKHTSIPKHPNIHYLGILDAEQVAVLWNAIDIAVFCNKRSPYGKQCMPQKFYEIVASQTPLVASYEGQLEKIQRDYPQSFYAPENLESLVDNLIKQFANPEIITEKIKSWKEQAADLNTYLINILQQSLKNIV